MSESDVHDCCGCKRSFAHFRTFIHNEEDDTYCEKSCSSWWRVIFVYLTYLIVVVIAFIMAVYGLNIFVRDSGIKHQINKTGLLPNNTPQLTIIPKLKKSKLLWYTNKGNNSKHLSSKFYINYLDKFFKKYENLDPEIYVDCGDPTINRKGKFCKFTKDMLGPCGRAGYGYPENKPCIYLKLNKMRGWNPWVKIGKGKDKDKPTQITGEEEEFSARRGGRANQTMTAECSGISTFGCDHMGKIKLYPKQYFQYYYFPYNGSKKYLSPLVGVQLLDIVKGLVVVITCSIWGIPMTPQVRQMLKTEIHVFIDNN